MRNKLDSRLKAQGSGALGIWLWEELGNKARDKSPVPLSLESSFWLDKLDSSQGKSQGNSRIARGIAEFSLTQGSRLKGAGLWGFGSGKSLGIRLGTRAR